jgi:hypothetical protein
MSMHHPLHFAVAEALQRRLAGRGELIRDTACGGSQHLPLFVGPTKGFDTRLCDVDLIIISENQVRVIVEIEESGFLPTKICGKFLQSAIATHLIHNSRPVRTLPYGKQVLFVQVLDGSKIRMQGTRKVLQSQLIERKINSMLPCMGSGITNYRLFFVQGIHDEAGLESVGTVVSTALT